MARRVPVGSGFFDRGHGSRRRCARIVICADVLLVKQWRVGLNVCDEVRGVRFTNAISEQTGDRGENERIRISVRLTYKNVQIYAILQRFECRFEARYVSGTLGNRE